MLFLVLFLGTEVNNAKCWFRIPYLGTIQPSEFMKVFLIIILAKLINDFNEKYISPTIMDEFKFLLKILLLVWVISSLQINFTTSEYFGNGLFMAFISLYINKRQIVWVAFNSSGVLLLGLNNQ